MIEVADLSYTYHAGGSDAVPALRGVSLRVAPGELVAIIGHNGSGKSTLARLLSAILTPTSGRIRVDGMQLDDSTLWEIRRRVGMVFQRPDDQLVANIVIDDVAFGPENLGLPRDEIERRVWEALDALELRELAHAQISELSGGEKQRVAIAGVLAMSPSYVIFDEPTTMLAPRMARQLLELAQDLRRRTGMALLHITHHMHELVGFDRVLVLHRGQLLIEGTPREVFARADELRAVGLNVPAVTELGQRLRARGLALPPAILTESELAEALAPVVEAREPAPTRANGRMAGPVAAAADAPAPEREALVEALDLRFTYMEGTPLAQEALRGVSCTVYRGETLALLGGSQAGKSTLVECFNGLRTPQAGRVLFAGEDVAAPGFDVDGLRRRVGIVFQQPEAQLFEETVGKDVSFAPRLRGLPPAESRALVERAMTAVGLDYETYRLRYIHALSGGQKRRAAIAGVLAAEPELLILDEPVAGLDPQGRAELAELIAELTRSLGLTVVLVGGAVDELAALAGRAIVLHEGRVASEGPLRALMRRADELHALGLELSEPAQIALALRPLLPDLPTDLLHLDELEAALLPRLLPALDAAPGAWGG
jgi:energy-coupling factor transport system ATP-binding protein